MLAPQVLGCGGLKDLPKTAPPLPPRPAATALPTPRPQPQTTKHSSYQLRLGHYGMRGHMVRKLGGVLE
jgi:hypothetical protein